MRAPLLIVGAGPTGLMLALQLRRRGAPFRIVDKATGPGTASRALAVQARTLEFYDQLGLADRLVAAGTKVEHLRMREGGEEVGVVPLGEIGAGLSPFPFVLCLPQDEHETLLASALREDGVEIEWGTTLSAIEPGADGVAVTISRAGRDEQATFDWVAGCDGARSTVRHAVGAEFPGGTYDRLYYVADVKPRQRPGPDLYLALDRDDFALMLPSRRGENERLIGFVPEGREQEPRFEDVRADVERLLGVEVEEVNWFSTYRVHHRVASHFRFGRCFLLGDAGHLHSPVGGQGMNTGIGDAVNLGWKLAEVAGGRAAPALLDTYEPERIPFARRLVETTDRAFQTITNEGVIGRVFRTHVMPQLLPTVARFGAGRRAMFRLLSQIGIAYPDSALSGGRAGEVRGGERLPWVRCAGNFAGMRSLGWQLHVFGTCDGETAGAAAALGLPVRTLPWSEDAAEAGFRRDAACLVRPDGYVALAQADGPALRAYADRLGLRFAGESATA